MDVSVTIIIIEVCVVVFLNGLADVFGASQLYIAFVLENSGMQLGSYVVCGLC